MINQEITMLSVDVLKPNRWNPNKMQTGVYQKLVSSVKKFGVFNAILARQIGTGKYEIIDGEHRWKACKELGYMTMAVRVIEATDEEVKQIIFSSTIKGKHDSFESQAVLKEFLDGTSTEDLKACNLDRGKLERKTKYINYEKGIKMHKGKKMKDEHVGLPTVDAYKVILGIPFDPKDYDKVIQGLEKIDKDYSKAILKLLK